MEWSDRCTCEHTRVIHVVNGECEYPLCRCAGFDELHNAVDGCTVSGDNDTTTTRQDNMIKVTRAQFEQALRAASCAEDMTSKQDDVVVAMFGRLGATQFFTCLTRILVEADYRKDGIDLDIETGTAIAEVLSRVQKKATSLMWCSTLDNAAAAEGEIGHVLHIPAIEIIEPPVPKEYRLMLRIGGQYFYSAPVMMPSIDAARDRLRTTHLDILHYLVQMERLDNDNEWVSV